eukprot:2910952-Rhodomonas_salina.1
MCDAVRSVVAGAERGVADGGAAAVAGAAGAAGRAVAAAVPAEADAAGARAPALQREALRVRVLRVAPHPLQPPRARAPPLARAAMMLCQHSPYQTQTLWKGRRVSTCQRSAGVV